MRREFGRRTLATRRAVLLLVTAGILAFYGTLHEVTTWLWVGCLGLSGLSFLVAGALGAVGLAFIGADYVRGGVHMDLSVFA